MNILEIKDFLDEKADFYNQPTFIETDPIQIPHQFSQKEDIEIAGFLTATIAWGNRKMIIKNALYMMELLEYSPFEFVQNHTENDLKKLEKFVHRTFNSNDFVGFIKGLQHVYKQHNGLENIFTTHQTDDSMQPAISVLKALFFEAEHQKRTEKHISNPLQGSAAKRINMFLRWMVRADEKGVDFGLWKNISPSKLSCPLDVHSGNVARKLNLLTRKQNDAKTLVALDKNLRILNPNDPVIYDFALFGLGVFEGF